MTQEKAKRIHFVYGIVLSVLLAAVGVCFIVSCWQIYQSGDAPFTRESIGAQFSKIAVPVWIGVAAVVGSAVLSLLLPRDSVKLRGSRDNRKNLEKMRTRVDFSRCKPIVAEQMWEEKLLRAVLRVEGVLLSAASAMPLLGYLLNTSNFTAELNASVKSAVLAAVPFLIVTSGVCLIVILLDAESVNWELALVKAVIAEGAVCKPQAEKPADETKKERAILIARIVIFAVAVLLIVLGVLNGGMRDVLGKAIKICTECIGLG